VSGENKGKRVQLLCEIAGHRHIPSVGVDDVNARQELHLRQVQAQSLESAFEFPFGSVGNFFPGLRTAYM
jgi:hypothetical protein